MSSPTEKQVENGMSAIQPGQSQTGKVVQEHEGPRVSETKEKGFLGKAADAIGLGSAKEDKVEKEDSSVLQGEGASAGNPGASGDTNIESGPRI